MPPSAGVSKWSEKLRALVGKRQARNPVRGTAAAKRNKTRKRTRVLPKPRPQRRIRVGICAPTRRGWLSAWSACCSLTRSSLRLCQTFSTRRLLVSLRGTKLKGGGRGGGKVVGPGGGGHERGESSVKGGDGGAGGEGGGGMHSTSREGWRALVRALEVDSELDSRLVPFVWPLHLSHLSRSFWCTWARAADDRSHVPATPLAREEDGDGSSAQVPLAVRMLLQVLEVYCLLSPCASTTTTNTTSSSSAAARRWGGLGAGAVVLPSLLCLSEGRGQGGPWYGRVRGAGAERVDAGEEGQAGEGESSCLVQGRARVLAADGGVGSSGMAAGDGDADESGANGGAEAMEGRVEGVGGERAEGMGGVSLEERGGVRSLFWFAAGCGVPALFLERCVQIWGERERERARENERE